MPALSRPRAALNVFLAALFLLTFGLQSIAPAQAAGTISLMALGATYTENFDTLASSGTSSTVPNGWDFVESGTNANTTYSAGTGSSNAGDSYSFGASSSLERAFGGLLSGSLVPTIGASFTNNTGSAINQLAISYTGEQWRLGTADRGPDRLDFQLSTDATSLTTGTWIDNDSLDFLGPVTTGTVGASDGNAAANRTAVSSTISGFSVPNGAVFWIRWTDFNASGADDGLAVDDFSLTAEFVATTTDPLINEFVFNHVGTDTNEYVEIFGDPNTGYSAFSILQIEGDGAGAGVVDSVHVAGTTDANGFWATGFLSNAFENGAVTLLLVEGFNGAVGQDLDTNNDGVLDATPWARLVDDVAVSDGGAGDWTYSSTILAPGFSGSPFTPGGASRIPNGADSNSAADWTLNDFDGAGLPGFTGTPDFGEAYNTPQAVNAAVMPQLVINEIDYDQPSTDTAEFVEIRNNGSTAVSLSGWTLELVNGTGGGAAVYNTINLPDFSLPAGSYFVVCANAATVANCDLDSSPNTDFIQNGAPDAVGLRFNGALIDAVSYEGNTGAPYTEGSGVGLEDPGVTGSDNLGISRCPDGVDTNQNNVDLSTRPITPGAANDCVVDTPPTVDSTIPLNGAADAPVGTNITINFSEPVTANGTWFDINCSLSGVHSAAVSGGPTNYTLDPDADFISGDSCTVTIFAANVTDQDGTPHTLAADFVFSFTAVDVCALPYTPIYSIQGSGLATPLAGQTVATQGVVIGDYEGPSPTLRGFYIQDLSGDGDTTTSDGIFVFNTDNDNVSLGQVVRVAGTAQEFQDQTQIGNVTSIGNCGTGAVAPADVTLPFPDANYPERFEGMLVRLPQTLYVTEHFQLGRFGQVLLSSGGRLQQPTNVVAPGAPALAMQAANDLNKIILDDDLQNQNPDPILFGRGGNPLSASNTLRGGDTAAGIVGVFTYTWAGNAASGNAYRVRPVTALGGGIPNFTPVNERPPTPASVGGTLRVAALNLLNYFNTFSGCTNGAGGAPTDCRGAENQTEFDRQSPKTVAAIVGINADVLGVIEIENDGYGPDSAIADLVNRLNAATAPGTYAFIDVDAATGQVNALGTDAIKVGLVYKPASVTPVGATAALNSVAFVNGGDSAPRNRPSLAQAFEQNSTGARFIVDVNHFKSKGSACDAPDAGDGQGNCNTVRLNAANELMSWLATDPTGIGDSDVVIIGDLNSYAKEDPITALIGGGFNNLIETLLGSDAYSFVFDGQWGYLDHALSSGNLVSQVTGITEWHINADEPSVLDYNTNFKSAGQITSLYSPDQFRVSDHDPVIVGLDLIAYNFTGFFPPVANPPAFNSVKAGSGVPVRFSLGGDRGLNIFNPGFPQSQQIACDSSAVLEPVEETVNAGGSSLTYDPLTDQYVYTWKTEKKWANTCRQLVIKLNDGTTHRANFRFTR